MHAGHSMGDSQMMDDSKMDHGDMPTEETSGDDHSMHNMDHGSHGSHAGHSAEAHEICNSDLGYCL